MRIKFEPTEAQREQVEMLAAVGTKHDLIARMVTDPATGRTISDKTLRKYFREELDLGLAKANAIIGGKLFDMARSGEHDACTMFWMKTRAGWRETNVQQNQTLDGNGKPITPSFGVSWNDGGPGHSIETSGGPAAADDEGSTTPEA